MNPTPTRAAVPTSAPLRAVSVAVLSAAAVLLAASGCTAPPTSPPSPVPTRTGADPTRTPPATLTAMPSAGTVTVEEGAFTDRIAFTDLALVPGARPVVTGSFANTADVSEVIVLELRADFYDGQGRYVGSGTATYADEEFTDTGATPLVRGPDGGTAVVSVTSEMHLADVGSAVLTVPQLVNE